MNILRIYYGWLSNVCRVVVLFVGNQEKALIMNATSRTEMYCLSEGA